MLDYLIILSMSLAGFAHMPTGVVVAGTAGLMVMSYWRHCGVYARGLELGYGDLMRGAAWMSGLHAIAASGFAFCGGSVIRLLAGA